MLENILPCDLYEIIRDKLSLEKLCEIRLRINQPITINLESGKNEFIVVQ